MIRPDIIIKINYLSSIETAGGGWRSRISSGGCALLKYLCLKFIQLPVAGHP
jgi:hypothetical protein